MESVVELGSPSCKDSYRPLISNHCIVGTIVARTFKVDCCLEFVLGVPTNQEWPNDWIRSDSILTFKRRCYKRSDGFDQLDLHNHFNKQAEDGYGARTSGPPAPSSAPLTRVRNVAIHRIIVGWLQVERLMQNIIQMIDNVERIFQKKQVQTLDSCRLE